MNDAPMRAWNRVIPMYCSMDFWAGGRTEATSETFGLYFSGRKVLEGILGDLDAFHGLRRPTKYSSRAFRADRLEWLTTLIGWPHATRMRALLA